MLKLEILNEVLDILFDRGYSVEGTTIIKNGVEKQAIKLNKEDKICPVIYTDTLLNSTDPQSIADEIENILNNTKPLEFDVNMIYDYANIKDKLIVALYNSVDENKVSQSFLDIFMTVKISLPEISATIPVTKGMLELWGKTTDEVIADAKANFRDTLSISSITDLIPHAASIDMPLPIVVSTKTKTYGAAALLFPEIWDSFEKTMGHKVYIIPSSIHELLILPDFTDDSMIPSVLAMIHEVNRTEVKPEEVLSDGLYIYEKGNMSVRRE